MKRFVGILQFLTRIPINIDIGLDEDFHKGLIYFPFVGLVLGILYYSAGYLSLLVFNHGITAVIILLCSVVLTGALHIDGVGDTFDGLFSCRDKDRMLEIMKDSRLGTNGLLAIVFLLLFKLIFIYYLLESQSLWAIIIMPICGRMNSALSCYKTTTPREKGMGNIFIGKMSTEMLMTMMGYGIFIIVLILYFLSGAFDFWLLRHISVLIVSFLLMRFFIWSTYKKIGGITGDILGAICEMAELVYLLGAYLIVTL